MATLSVKAGQTFQSDNHTIYKIVSGDVTISYSTGQTEAYKGDMLGTLELFLDEPTFIYEANSDVTLQTLPMADLNALESQISANAGIGKALFSIALNQYNSLARDYEMKFYEVDALYTSLQSDFTQYSDICASMKTPVVEPEHMADLKAPARLGNVAVSAFYDQFENPDATLNKELSKNPWVAAYLIYHIGLDCQSLIKAHDLLEEYHMLLLSCYLNEDGTGFVNLALNTLSKFRSSTPDVESLLSSLRFTIASLGSDSCIDEDMCNECSKQLDSIVETLENGAGEEAMEEDVSSDDISNAEAEEAIANSLHTIVTYACLPEADIDPLFASIQAFEKLSDRASTEDDARKICRTLIGYFNRLYGLVAKKAVRDANVPVVIKMFLYFGYMDEAVAGRANAIELYKLAATHKQDPDSNVYPFFEWLKAIYNGKKEPSRNEFEQDYADSIHAMKVSNQINAIEERELLENQIKKVEYELENVFPSVNKITYGRISTFCPVFSSHNVPGSLTKSIITNDKISEIVDYIKKIDYSAYAREMMISLPKLGISKEYVHVDILPDFILLPNVGVRGAMWQEIESKKRSTPSRMMLPIFLLGELKPAVLRMTGEYRWEMCKRIQGARWNDVSDPSLTSEFFDYVQFYRKNIDLSSEAKEKIKNNLVRSKNNFKEMFIIDYMSWIMFESAGSPRLNKVSRAIMAKFCPFSKPIRDKIGTNPQFQQLIERYNHQHASLIHRLDGIRAKAKNAGIELPIEIEAEYEYLNR